MPRTNIRIAITWFMWLGPVYMSDASEHLCNTLHFSGLFLSTISLSSQAIPELPIMSGWNITCINQSSDNTVFLLFIDNRKLSETGSFYTNVFYRSAVVGSHGGRRDISIDGEVYGVCGSADEPLKPKTSVRDAQPTQSPLQPSPGEPNAVACRADINNLSFSDAITTMSTLEAGEIGIQVDSFFSDRLRKFSGSRAMSY